MKKKIKYFISLIMIVIIIYYVFDLFDIHLNNTNIFKIYYKEFDYPNITNSNFEYNISKFFNTNNIINYEYGTIFLKEFKKSNNITTEKKEINNKVISTSKEQKKETVPLVYIYNTHNKESYAKVGGLSHNITPNVVTVSYMLKELLEKNGIYSIVEEKKVSDVLDRNKWNYASSYRVTKQFLTDSKKKNPSLKFFVDVHRDSVKKTLSTITINNKDYAKIMFVLGLENNNYKENLVLMEYLNNLITKEYPGLSRGIYKKKGKGVNGVYNQDFSKNCILIEFGGEENTLEEVYNTVEIISKYLSLYIGDYNENK